MGFVRLFDLSCIYSPMMSRHHSCDSIFQLTCGGLDARLPIVIGTVQSDTPADIYTDEKKGKLS